MHCRAHLCRRHIPIKTSVNMPNRLQPRLPYHQLRHPMLLHTGRGWLNLLSKTDNPFHHLENYSAAKRIWTWCHPCPSLRRSLARGFNTHYDCAGLSLNQTKQRVCLLRLVICHITTTHPVSLRPIPVAGFHVPYGESVPTDSTCDGFPH